MIVDLPRYPTEQACKPGVSGEAFYECQARDDVYYVWRTIRPTDAKNCVDMVDRLWPTYTLLRRCLAIKYEFPFGAR